MSAEARAQKGIDPVPWLFALYLFVFSGAAMVVGGHDAALSQASLSVTAPGALLLALGVVFFVAACKLVALGRRNAGAGIVHLQHRRTVFDAHPQLRPRARRRVAHGVVGQVAHQRRQAGAIALQTHQRVAGVIENMSGLPCPHCGELVDVFGSGGGEAVAAALTRLTGAPVPLLGKVPIDVTLREGADAGIPLVLGHPESAVAQQLTEIAAGLARSRGLAGRRLGLSPV